MRSPSDVAPGSRVLVVDDDPDVREVMAEYLEARGYFVVQAGDGDEALAWLAADPLLRLVVSDVRMARVSGLELAQTAAIRHPGVRVVLISGYFQSQTAGPRFLMKPFTMQELEEVVQAELAYTASMDRARDADLA